MTSPECAFQSDDFVSEAIPDLHLVPGMSDDLETDCTPHHEFGPILARWALELPDILDLPPETLQYLNELSEEDFQRRLSNMLCREL